MTAYVPFTRWLRSGALAGAAVWLAAGAGAVLPRPGSAADRPVAARGQAPEGPKAPEGPLPPIQEPDPSTVPPPAAPPTIHPAGYSPAATPGPPPLTDPLRDKQVLVAAYIGTEAVITEDEVWQMVRQRGREYITLAGGEREAKERAIYKEELKRLIDRELVIIELLGRLKKAKKDDVIRELNDQAGKTADRKMSDYRKMNKFGSEEEFHKILKAQGLSYKGVRRQIERDFMVSIFVEQVIKDKIKFITLNDLWDYYQANPKEFTTEDRAKWLDLFVAYNRFPTPAEAKQYADGVWRQATGGGDFVQLVRTYGQGDSNLRDGEGIGQKRGEVQPPEMEGVIFKMAAGEVSPLLQTATGYHIVKVVEREVAGVKPFDPKVQTEIREKLARQVHKSEYERQMDDLWRKYRPKVAE